MHPLVGLFRATFRRWRPHGYVRVGQAMGTLVPGARWVTVDDLGSTFWLDLRRSDSVMRLLDDSLGAIPDELALLCSLVRHGETVLDVGANIGTHAVALASAVGPTGRVIAYEPDAEMLQRNAAPFPQILVRPVAVAERDGEVVFRRGRASQLSHTVEPLARRRHDRTLPSVALDQEATRLGTRSVALLKIDVEGGDGAVLDGAHSLLRGANPPCVYLEWEPSYRGRRIRDPLAALYDITNQDWLLLLVQWGRPVGVLERGAVPAEKADLLAIPPCHQERITHRFGHSLPTPLL